MKCYIFLACFLLVRAPSPVSSSSCDQPKIQEIVHRLFPYPPSGGIWVRGADAEEMTTIDYEVAAATYWNKRLRIELFSLSKNSHTLLRADEQRDRELEHRAIASAVVEALMDLRTMERADEIVTSATLKAAHQNLRTATCDENVPLVLIDVEELFHDFLVTINETMRASEPLFEEMYASALDASLSSQMPGDEYDDADDDEDDDDDTPQDYQEPISFEKDPYENVDLEQPILRPAFVNKVFIKEAAKYRRGHGNETDGDYWFGLFASAMMELAKGSDDGESHERLNEVYHAVVEVISKTLPWADVDEKIVKNHIFALLHKALQTQMKELHKMVKQSMHQLEAQRKYLKVVREDTPL